MNITNLAGALGCYFVTYACLWNSYRIDPAEIEAWGFYAAGLLWAWFGSALLIRAFGREER